MFLLQHVNANDKVIIIADTRHTQRWSERKIDPMLCKGDPAFSVLAQPHWKACVSGHTSALLVSHEMWVIWKQSNFPTFLERSLKINTLTRCAQVCFASAEEDQAEHDHGTIDEVLGDQDMPWKKLIEKLICLNRCFYPGHPESEKERLAS